MDSQTSDTSISRRDAPSVESSDPNERKLARRLRIQARLEAAAREKAKEEGTYVEPEPEKPLITETIEICEDTLNQLYLEGKEYVSNVIVASDAKEVARREAVEEEKNNRERKLREDTAIAFERLEEISKKWEAIMELNGPIELYEDMKVHKAKCLELIEQKNNMIKSFQRELKDANENFMKGRREMYDELALLTKRIDEQVLVMKRAYRLELKHVEDSVDVTRTQLIDIHEETWQRLYQKREKEEVSNMTRKFSLVENFYEELHKLHVDHEEKYRALRIHLERDIQTLEQELERVKALCLLNSEKLDYNYQVLKKREEENVYIKNHQKRRLNKLQDMINTVKRRIDEKKQLTDEEYKRLSKDVQRYYKNILDTERKAERFSNLNNDTFLNIWDMKEEEAKELLDKVRGSDSLFSPCHYQTEPTSREEVNLGDTMIILTADMVIHEQILGVNWIAPANKSFCKMDLPSYKTAAAVVENVTRQKMGVQAEGGLLRSKFSATKAGEASIDALNGKKRLLRHIFELIADQSGFLMEERLDDLLNPFTEYEKTFVRLDNVFVAIGVRTDADITALKNVFLPYAVCLLCNKRLGSTDSTKSAEKGPDDGIGDPKAKGQSRNQSILQIRELEEKVSKLRLQAKAQDTETGDESSSEDTRLSRDSENLHEGSHVMRTSSQAKRSQEQRSTQDVAKVPSECNISHPLYIEKFFVLRALKDFVSIYNSSRLQTLTSLEEKTQRKRFTLSRLLLKNEMLLHWEKYKEFPSRAENVWNGVHAALTRYLELLKERHKLNLRAQGLRRQNMDLKRLLSYYKITDTCEQFKLPVILPVPNEPIDPIEIAHIVRKLAL